MAAASLHRRHRIPQIEINSFTYAAERVQLHPGDLLVMITDGVTEAQDPAQLFYGLERALAWLADLQHNTPRWQSVEAICQGLYADVNRFANGAVPTDDITIMAVRFTEPLPTRPSAPYGKGGTIIFTSTGAFIGRVRVRGCGLGAPPLTSIKCSGTPKSITFFFIIFAKSVFPTISTLTGWPLRTTFLTLSIIVAISASSSPDTRDWPIVSWKVRTSMHEPPMSVNPSGHVTALASVTNIVIAAMHNRMIITRLNMTALLRHVR
jgi:Stage II sporulation protein E (SpoIIE)